MSDKGKTNLNSKCPKCGKVLLTMNTYVNEWQADAEPYEADVEQDHEGVTEDLYINAQYCEACREFNGIWFEPELDKPSMTRLFTMFIESLGNDAELSYKTDPRARALIDCRFRDYLLACKHFDLVKNGDNCDYGVNNPTSFQSEDSSKRFFKPK